MERLYDGVVEKQQIGKLIADYEAKQVPREFDVVFAELVCACDASGSSVPTLQEVRATVETLKVHHNLHLIEALSFKRLCGRPRFEDSTLSIHPRIPCLVFFALGQG